MREREREREFEFTTDLARVSSKSTGRVTLLVMQGPSMLMVIDNSYLQDLCQL
jgi:hypothetical protein